MVGLSGPRVLLFCAHREAVGPSAESLLFFLGHCEAGGGHRGAVAPAGQHIILVQILANLPIGSCKTLHNTREAQKCNKRH